ncbi:DUF6705 family protein [uncultured Chryseobacterium sp.]|uniref:DUF6705 family protein n=1 Tax=uncultured Chryseobacterium sp. TaxID=259322 RepID=UPI0025F264CF|nr:DUF6705 family protein [uncultured Chryseobacterium sp.]
MDIKITPLKKTSLVIYVVCISSCQAQNLPLSTALSNIPENAHVKDLNNELTPYIGTYKATFNGNEVILFISKEDDKYMHYGSQEFYRDALVMKYVVKNSTGTILQDTKNSNSSINIVSTKIKSAEKSVIFIYSGTNCGVGWGDIYLKKLNSTQISWEYIPDSTIIDSRKCPPGTDTTIYLPETKDLIFTKQ